MITINDEQILKLAIEADLIDARDIGGHKVVTLPDPFVAAIYKFAELAQKPLLVRIAELEHALSYVVRVWVVSDEAYDPESETKKRVERFIEQARKKLGVV